ncbi:MAG: DUF4352 domain-containing protein [Tepidiformaceae bacterium]
MAKNNLERQLKDLDALKQRGVLTEEEYASRRAALLASTESAVAGKQGGSAAKGIFKWGFLGCLGILGAIGALVVVLIVIIAAAVGSDTSEEGSDVHVSLADGASGVIFPGRLDEKKTKVTLVRVIDPATSDNQFTQPDAGNRYWAVEVQIENVGTQEVNGLDWKLRGSNDFEYDREFVSGVGAELELFTNLTPGAKQQGLVVFEIPADVTPKWLRADPNPFIANDLYFDAP